MKLDKGKKKKTMIVVAIAAAVVCFVATVVIFLVAEFSKTSIQGEWNCKEEGITFSFNEDKTLSANLEKAILPIIETEYTGQLAGEYSIDESENVITITIFYYNKKLTQHYSYEIKDNSLALKNLNDATTSVFYKISEKQ